MGQGGGKTFRIEQAIHTADGVLAAEVSSASASGPSPTTRG
ncbi:hypothetical protein [Streptomyces sp. H27-D2]|nr:hypothetical protein [Streptomyces sp. H27-D2]MEC4021003.1 hypothetical protein [Streptomyces sp. H27-D2]